LKHFHCDDLHIILSLSAVQIHEFRILMFIRFTTLLTSNRQSLHPNYPTQQLCFCENLSDKENADVSSQC